MTAHTDIAEMAQELATDELDAAANEGVSPVVAPETAPRAKKRKKPKKPLLMVGWREWAVLSLAQETPVQAKIDTGAASSSVHASNIVQARDPFGRMIASFDLHLFEDRDVKTRIHSHPVIDSRMVLSSSGHWSSRPVVNLGLQLGDSQFETEVTLASRDEMEFRLLIGRASLRKRFCVDPCQSFVLGEPECQTTK